MDSDQVLKDLRRLLSNFEVELRRSDLRSKVQALIPAFQTMRALGASLVSDVGAAGARDRILSYLLRYPLTVIQGAELMVISGIGEWGRRVRELRVQFGWAIASGVTMKGMIREKELDVLDISDLKPDDYMLLSVAQDKEAAHRWNVANEIRRRKQSVQNRILSFLRANVGHAVTGEELRYVAGNRSEWARRVRELRTEEGWRVVTRNTGRPDLDIGVYLLERDGQLPKHDRRIPDPVRREVLQRDGLRCQMCGWDQSKWDPSDARNLELHHSIHHVKGGTNTPENLVTLCNVCHDQEHRGAPRDPSG